MVGRRGVVLIFCVVVSLPTLPLPAAQLCARHLSQLLKLQLEGSRELTALLKEAEPDLVSLAVAHDKNPYGFFETVARSKGLKFSKRLFHLFYADLSQVMPFVGYSAELRKQILRQTHAIQLENVCGENCWFCGVTHNKKGPYLQIPVPTLRSIFREMGIGNGAAFLYGESDPLRFHGPHFRGAQREIDYVDLHQMQGTFTYSFPFCRPSFQGGRRISFLKFTGVA